MTKYLIPDLATLTTITEHSLGKLVDKAKFIICHDVKESMLEGETDTVIEIGIGTITIRVDEDGIRYRFTPAPSLDEAIKETVRTGKSPLVYELETALAQRIEKVNKELF